MKYQDQYLLESHVLPDVMPVLGALVLSHAPERSFSAARATKKETPPAMAMYQGATEEPQSIALWGTGA